MFLCVLHAALAVPSNSTWMTMKRVGRQWLQCHAQRPSSAKIVLCKAAKTAVNVRQQQ
jgi:hypothetical protein